MLVVLSERDSVNCCVWVFMWIEQMVVCICNPYLEENIVDVLFWQLMKLLTLEETCGVQQRIICIAVCSPLVQFIYSLCSLPQKVHIQRLDTTSCIYNQINYISHEERGRTLGPGKRENLLFSKPCMSRGPCDHIHLILGCSH